MNVLIIDIENLGLDFALRCADAGHSVKLFRYLPKRHNPYGEGFKQINLVDSWKDHMAWAKDGLIVNTGNYVLLYEMDRYRQFGYPIFSPTVSSAKLETDRGYGMETMKAVGIDLPPYSCFGSMQEAAKAAKKTDQTFVFKVLDGSAEDKAMTFVPHDARELHEWMERKIKAGVNVKSCMLQEKLETDFEIGINGWFGPSGFLPDKFQISFEHKPLMPGDIGPNTGEMCSISQYVEHDNLVEEFLMPLEPVLKALGHVGDFCVGAMIDKSGKAWPLECTARMGYPAFFGQLASHRGDPCEWMKALLEGKDKLHVSYDVCAAVVLAQPNWPYNNSPPDLVEGNPIKIDPAVERDIHLCSVMKKGDKLETTHEYVAVATAMGKTIGKARDKVYDSIKGVKIPNVIYRDDVGEKVERALSTMHKAGYALTLKN